MGIVTKEDVDTLKNDWLTDNVYPLPLSSLVQADTDQTLIQTIAFWEEYTSPSLSLPRIYRYTDS